MAHDQAAVGDAQRHREFLLDEQHRHAAFAQHHKEIRHLRDQLRCQTFGGFVDDEQVRVAHQRARQRQHLLLTTGQDACQRVAAQSQLREQAVHVGEGPARMALTGLLAQDQVVLHRQARKNVAALGHISQARAGPRMHRLAQHLLPVHPHAAGGLHPTHDGTRQRGAARAVAPQHRHNFTRTHSAIHTMQDLAFAVPGLQTGELQNRLTRVHIQTAVPR